MITTTYGYKVPETGDSGTTLFEALEDNITRLDGHSHDGVDSEQLSAQNIVGVTQSILAASWSSVGLPTGHYKQQVTLPAGFSYDTTTINFRITSTGEVVTPTVEKVSSTQYYVYTIDNSLAYTAVYGG